MIRLDDSGAELVSVDLYVLDNLDNPALVQFFCKRFTWSRCRCRLREACKVYVQVGVEAAGSIIHVLIGAARIITWSCAWPNFGEGGAWTAVRFWLALLLVVFAR
jgi:hypothetical protein